MKQSLFIFTKGFSKVKNFGIDTRFETTNVSKLYLVPPSQK